jgi:prepilin-type N-terminal cleavage/methylation domain-containing protein
MSEATPKSIRKLSGRAISLWAGLGLVLTTIASHVASLPYLDVNYSLYEELWIYVAIFFCGYAGFAMLHYVVISRPGKRDVKPSFFVTNMAMPPLAVLFISFITLTLAPTALVFSLVVLPLTMPTSRGYPRPCSLTSLTCFYLLLALIHSSWDFFFIFTLVLDGEIDGLEWLLESLAENPLPIICIFGFFILLNLGFVPWHRRTGRFLWPSQLPSLPKRKRGFTLIEMLIVIAILAIMAVGIAQSTMATHRTLQRQEEYMLAVNLIEDEFALLRSRAALPEVGLHKLEPELEKRPFAEQAEVEIKAGPEESLREVRVTIQINGDANQREVVLFAILPARAGQDAE